MNLFSKPLLWICSWLMMPFLLHSQGNLVIVGGGLENDNDAVFEEFIRLAGGTDAIISIIPAASGVAVQTAAYFSLGLLYHGVKPENIQLIPIAMEDDDSTANINEAKWKANAWDVELAQKVRAGKAVWFSGGDQLRIMKLMFDEQGKPSPVMKAVWEVYRSGGVIGGTSAGAAIMSNPMIGGGTSLGALEHGVELTKIGEDKKDFTGVILTTGIGFFPHGIVDQHFHARARTGRLVAILGFTGQRFGFGIDENTALVFYGNENRMKVAGKAGITIFDTQNAVFRKQDPFLTVKNLKVHYLENGDQYLFDTDRPVAASEKKQLRNISLANKKEIRPGGAFSTEGQGFYELLTEQLFEEKASATSNLHFFNQNQAFRLSLSLDSGSQLYLYSSKYGKNHYTATNLQLNIEAVKLEIKPLNDN